MMSSPTQSPAKNKQQKSIRVETQTLTSVTVRQLHTASRGHDDTIRVDNREVTLVTVLGRILSVQELENNIVLVLTDGTGSIEARLFSKNGRYVDRHKAEWTPGTYVRVFGQPRLFSNTMQINAYRFERIADFNDLTLHFLEVIRTHLLNLFGPLDDGTYRGENGTGAQQQQQQQMQQQMVGGQTGAGGSLFPGLNLEPLQEACLSIIQNHAHSSTGVGLQDLHAYLHSAGFPGVSQNQLREVVIFLANEGHIFNTIDENHFKPTI